jgi:acetyl esterase
MARVDERKITAGGREVWARLYYPRRGPDEGAPRAALVYLHGGGWTMFSLDTHDRLMREYADRSGLIVVGVDYALSPEAKFPRALEEVVGVLAWLAREGASVGVDPARLLVGGDSAGANLAVAACLKLRDAGRGALALGLLLNYGVFRASSSEEAIRRYGGPAFMLSGEEMKRFWHNYLNTPDEADNPLASPLLADLAGLPPAFLAIAECDILAEQNHVLAERLRGAGVPTRAVVYPGATHSFLEAVSISALSDRALEEASAWLMDRAALAVDG